PTACYCDPESPASMAEALAGALSEDRDLRRAERERHASAFTWRETGERAARALEEVMAKPAATVPRRRRVAWVSPAPPTTTGIADYALEVADVLAERFDLEWVYDPDGTPPAPDLMRRYPTFGADEIESRHEARPFDLFVYHVGNSYYHSYMLPLMTRFPGLT